MMTDLSRNEQIVYAALVEAAEQGQPCPVNMDLEMLAGLDSCSMGSWLMARLEAKGMIVVRRYQRFREVQIVETGKWTARHPSMHVDRPHVPRGMRSRGPRPTDRKPYKRGR